MNRQNTTHGHGPIGHDRTRGPCSVSGPGWRRMTSVLGCLAALAGGLAAFAPPAGAQGAAPKGADFNGDGYADLAIGAEGQTIGTEAAAGAVTVVYGGSAGLWPGSRQLWHQDVPGVAGVATFYDRFGAALTWGDFNADGYDDLAVGAPGDNVGSVSWAGAVNVLYGTRAGLTASGNQLWHQTGLADTSEGDDRFGQALAAGDFNGDGYADLAVGAPGENGSSGLVHVLRGSPSGLIPLGNQRWNQDSPGVPGEAEGGDWFGGALAARDFNGDGRDDLAIGARNEDVEHIYGDDTDAGSVYVLYGSAVGLRGDGSQGWSQDSDGVPGDPEDNDRFGWALAAGDFNGDGYADLAVGTPGENGRKGAVYVLYGSSHGLNGEGSQGWNQDMYSVQDVAETDDQFGRAVAAGDFNGDGRADLAVGVPGESVSGLLRAGAVNVLYGAAGGLTDAGNQFWHQDSPLVQDACELADNFGSALRAGDFNGDGRAELAVGVPAEDSSIIYKDGPRVNAGAVHVLYGSASGLLATWNQFWYDNTPSPDSSPLFGGSL